MALTLQEANARAAGDVVLADGCYQLRDQFLDTLSTGDIERLLALCADYLDTFADPKVEKNAVLKADVTVRELLSGSRAT